MSSFLPFRPNPEPAASRSIGLENFAARFDDHAEIPYQVQKAKLVEKIADLMMEKKLPLLGDVRDESAEEVRRVLEPKARTIDPMLLMESMSVRRSWRSGSVST